MKLRLLREKYNLTQPALAKRLGVGCSVISLWENMHVTPTATNMQKLQDLFGREKIKRADFKKPE